MSLTDLITQGLKQYKQVVYGERDNFKVRGEKKAERLEIAKREGSVILERAQRIIDGLPRKIVQSQREKVQKFFITEIESNGLVSLNSLSGVAALVYKWCDGHGLHCQIVTSQWNNKRCFYLYLVTPLKK